jgi:ribosomal protein L11 methyltransferase
MDYIELKSVISPISPWQEVLISELSNIGFESFLEEKDCLLSYIPKKDFDFEKVQALKINPSIQVSHSYRTIYSKNWNEEWEKNYDAVIINSECRVIAPFHKRDNNYKYEIIIEPKMSFGTGHHETTSLMLELILSMQIKDKKIIDIGCGTGILGILAGMMGASSILCIDNDVNTFENAQENIKANLLTDKCSIKLGGSDFLKTINENYDVILANINRNVLLSDIAKYKKLINKHGKLLMSGFYEYDFKSIEKEARKHGFTFNRKLIKNDWVASEFSYDI